MKLQPVQHSLLTGRLCSGDSQCKRAGLLSAALLFQAMTAGWSARDVIDVLGAGIPWLFANLALASFIKFKDSQVTAIAVTVVLGIGCLYFFLSHGRWLRYVSGFSQSDMQSHLKVREKHCPGVRMAIWASGCTFIMPLWPWTSGMLYHGPSHQLT